MMKPIEDSKSIRWTIQHTKQRIWSKNQFLQCMITRRTYADDILTSLIHCLIHCFWRLCWWSPWQYASWLKCSRVKYILMTLYFWNNAETVTTSCHEQLFWQKRKSLLIEMIQIHWQTIQQKVSLQVQCIDHISAEIDFVFIFCTQYDNIHHASCLNGNHGNRSACSKEVHSFCKNSDADACNSDSRLISNLPCICTASNTRFCHSVCDMINVNCCVRVWILDQNSRQERLPVCWHHPQRIRRNRVFFLSKKLFKWKTTIAGHIWTDQSVNQKHLLKMCKILAKSRGWSNEDLNKKQLFIPLHDAFHRVFWNGTIQEQIFQILWISSTWLTNEFKRDMMKILKESDQEYYYQRGVFMK